LSAAKPIMQRENYDGFREELNPSDADRGRMQWAEDQGFRVMRFWNNEVLSNTVGVLDANMTAAANHSPGTPQLGAPPSPTRGEGNEDQ